MATVNVNGVTISGGNISIVNGKVYVDGNLVETGEAKTININVEGSVESIKADACSYVKVSGDAGTVSTVSGDVQCGNVLHGSVSTVNGDVKCGNVMGNVSTVSGDISRGK
ncbi:hypothetical protein [Burkholderia phage BCSR5]|nr:hypothetical protein [Burkholderia phage BCSR5]